MALSAAAAARAFAVSGPEPWRHAANEPITRYNAPDTSVAPSMATRTQRIALEPIAFASL